METEYEATFWPVDKDEVRTRLKATGAALSYPERLMRRYVYYLPKGAPADGTTKPAWARVRDEGDRITVSVKASGTKIEEQKEAEIEVSSFEKAHELLVLIGCDTKAFQETKRELWKLDGADITIDEWPFLEPFVEVESTSEEIVRAVSEKIGFEWSSALFCSADVLYAKRYGFETEVINNQTPRLAFNDPNPFQK